MKAKLYLAIVVSVLLSLIACPALAGDETTDPILMWVSRARLAHVGRSSTGTDAMVAMIHVRDANRQKVEDAWVTVGWTLPDGSPSFPPSVLTDEQGIARFTVWAGTGVYRLRVLDVTKAGWQYYEVVTAAYPFTAR